MAGEHPFLKTLRGTLAALDDEALASLANKGLLRRAQKDLEAAPPRIVAVEEDRVRLELPGATVEVPELPNKSTCSCPATGICRHILAALVFLRERSHLAPRDDAPPHLAERDGHSIVANASDDDLKKWAGKSLFKKALKALAANPQVEIAAAETLVIRFPSRNITCRWIPSGGLSGMACSCQAEAVCEHVVAAVLAYQASLGKRQVTVEQTILAESAGAPRSRAEVLDSVRGVLRELVSLGLARLSAATAERLTTLAISAHGVDLPRLSRLLKGLAHETRLALARDAQASSAGLLAQAARLEVLRFGLAKNAAPALVGQHRTQYYDVGQITLLGLGARHWRTPGGYHGLTVYFWDKSRDAFATWTESRPINQLGFDPAGRFWADGPWDGCGSPFEASHSVLRLSGAWRNQAGRISGRPSTRAIVVGPAVPGEVPTISKWSVLAERAKTLFGGGLGESAENLDLVLLAPRHWGPGGFDSLRQELLRPVFDEEGRPINLWLPYTDENANAIELLERHDAAQTIGLLGALRLVAGQVRVAPITLYTHDKFLHLNLQRPEKGRAKGKPSQQFSSEEDVEDDMDEDYAPAGVASALGRMLITAQAELESLAESGIAVRRNFDVLASVSRRLESLGLVTCSRPLTRLLDTLASSAKLAESDSRGQAAGALLTAYYVLRLASEQETVVAACGGLGK